MHVQVSLPDEPLSHPLDVEMREAALSQDAASATSIRRLFWTGLGLTAFILIAFSTCALHPLTSHATAKRPPLVPEIAFSPMSALGARGVRPAPHPYSRRPTVTVNRRFGQPASMPARPFRQPVRMSAEPAGTTDPGDGDEAKEGAEEEDLEEFRKRMKQAEDRINAIERQKLEETFNAGDGLAVADLDKGTADSQLENRDAQLADEKSGDDESFTLPKKPQGFRFAPKDPGYSVGWSLFDGPAPGPSQTSGQGSSASQEGSEEVLTNMRQWNADLEECVLRNMVDAFDNYNPVEVEALLASLSQAALAGNAEAEKSLQKLAALSRQMDKLEAASMRGAPPELVAPEARMLRFKIRMWGKDGEKYQDKKSVFDLFRR